MTLKEHIEQDLKTALLAGDKNRTSVLRGLKSAIGYEEVAKNARAVGLNEQDTLAVLAKEAKKRQESADLYAQGGDETRAAQERNEKAIIEAYLPTPLTDTQLNELIDQAMNAVKDAGPQGMGKIIAHVKAAAGGAADGATIARLVKERLNS